MCAWFPALLRRSVPTMVNVFPETVRLLVVSKPGPVCFSTRVSPSIENTAWKKHRTPAVPILLVVSQKKNFKIDKNFLYKKIIFIEVIWIWKYSIQIYIYTHTHTLTGLPSRVVVSNSVPRVNLTSFSPAAVVILKTQSFPELLMSYVSLEPSPRNFWASACLSASTP